MNIKLLTCLGFVLSSGNFLKLVATTSYTSLSIAGKINPVVGGLMAVLELSGATDAIYKSLGKSLGDK